MADRTSIEWTDASWTPVKGCSRASEGCRNCYAEIMAARFSQPGQWGEGLARIVDTPNGKDHRWTGVTRFDEAELTKPLHWRKARRVFVCSTSDLFHETVSFDVIDKVMAVMAMCPQHTFQVLTKRAARMHAYFSDPAWAARVSVIVNAWPAKALGYGNEFTADFRLFNAPLPNIWLGVSVEDQERAVERIPALLATPAAIRWVSCEPLLGTLDLRAINLGNGIRLDGLTGWHSARTVDLEGRSLPPALPGIDWVVVGGESGPGARPMHPDWVRSLRDQCVIVSSFFFKQWGEWFMATHLSPREDQAFVFENGAHAFNGAIGARVGKKAAGRTLDGAQHDAMPREVAHV